jgi:hypothetical protein
MDCFANVTIATRPSQWDRMAENIGRVGYSENQNIFSKRD